MKKLITQNIFGHYYKIAFESNSYLIRQYERYETDNKSRLLMYLYVKIFAYDIAIKTLAWKDYPQKNLQSKSIIGNVKTNIEYFGKNNVEYAKQKVNENFQSSFINKHSRKIKQLNEALTYMQIIPVYNTEDFQLKLQDSQSLSLLDDLQQNWLTAPQYVNKRKEQAELLQKDVHFSRNDIANLQKITFCEIAKLIEKYHQLLNAYSKSFTQSEIKELIIFLERGIMIYLPIFLKDLEIKEITSLANVYKTNRPHFITICHYCGKPMARLTKSHCCTRHENRRCYLHRVKNQKEEPFPSVLLRTHNKCDVCKNHSSLNYIHRVGGHEMQFCSIRCLRIMQKRVQRYKKQSTQCTST